MGKKSPAACTKKKSMSLSPQLPSETNGKKVSCVEHVSERRVEHELELQSSAEESPVAVAEREDDPYTYVCMYIQTYVCMGLS